MSNNNYFLLQTELSLVHGLYIVHGLTERAVHVFCKQIRHTDPFCSGALVEKKFPQSSMTYQWKGPV